MEEIGDNQSLLALAGGRVVYAEGAFERFEERR
jgi:hypothetical protein